MSLFKFYLGRILGSYEKKEDCGPLLLYQQQPRTMIGKVLIQLEPPGPYMPLFYQKWLSDSSCIEVSHIIYVYYIHGCVLLDLVTVYDTVLLLLRMTACSSLCVIYIS